MGRNPINPPPAAQGPESVFVVPFRTLLQSIGFDQPESVPANITLTREQFLEAVRLILRAIAVDETWYRQQYPDVDQAITNGTYKSAKQHFIENGYFEGRRPGRAVVDEQWYLSAYPDVAEGIEIGEITSCQDHFDAHGEAEGRLPREY